MSATSSGPPGAAGGRRTTSSAGPPRGSCGGAPPYHFVGETPREKLRGVAGDNPSPEKVLAVRKALAGLADEFALIRQPPDWKVEVVEKEATPPPMPIPDLPRSGSTFLPPSR